VDDGVVRVLTELKKETDVSLEMGVQTSNNETLRRINRGHTFGAVISASERCRKAGIEFGFHVILGLPGEDRVEMHRTAEDLASLGHQTLKIHHFHVCRGTHFEKEYTEGRIRVPTLEFHAMAAVDFLERTPGDVAIQRLMGDALRDTLVAPEWTLDKPAALRAVKAEFQKRGTRQGARTSRVFSF
jgi:radical SAM protein (TIGR01212 family)